MRRMVPRQTLQLRDVRGTVQLEPTPSDLRVDPQQLPIASKKDPRLRQSRARLRREHKLLWATSNEPPKAKSKRTRYVIRHSRGPYAEHSNPLPGDSQIANGLDGADGARIVGPDAPVDEALPLGSSEVTEIVWRRGGRERGLP